MDQTKAYSSLLQGTGRRSRMVILFLIALTLHARGSLAQSEKIYESLLIPDASIPDFVALAKTDAVKESSIKLLLKIKKDSLVGRLVQTDLTLERLNRRKDEAEAVTDRLRREIEDSKQQALGKSSVVPISRAAAEQLLIAAQLELQKVSWDLAGEVASLESAAKARNAESKAEVLERQLAKLESTNIEEDLQSAEADLQRVESLAKENAISSTEVAKFRLSVSKAKNALVMHQLRSQLAEAQQIALKDAQSAEAETQIRRLTARKDQIEEYIQGLFNAMKELPPREELSNRVVRSDQTMATLSKLVDEAEAKKDEIKGLLQFLDMQKSNEDKK